MMHSGATSVAFLLSGETLGRLVDLDEFVFPVFYGTMNHNVDEAGYGICHIRT
jgi:hypothetical protein